MHVANDRRLSQWPWAKDEVQTEVQQDALGPSKSSVCVCMLGGEIATLRAYGMFQAGAYGQIGACGCMTEMPLEHNSIG